MVRHIHRHELYALKCISKEQCIRMNAVRNIVRERTILEHLDHPLVCNMKFAFQDTRHIYMVMDLMLGGDLRFHLSRQKLPEHVVRFWMAELACAVKYLHSQGVIHRDIKPDNILLDQSGHVHLSDFNLACPIPKHRPLTSPSGTAVYFAPEVFKGAYSEAADWWSVGVTFYECIYGKRPWASEQGDELRQCVLRGHVRYRESGLRPVSTCCITAIQGFLEADPSKRFGHDISGWTSLLQHPFFSSIDWHLLDAKQGKPPYQPSSVEANFDVMEQQETEPGDTHDLLSAWLFPRTDLPRKKNLPAGISLEKYEHDLATIVAKFLPFDFTVYEQYEGFLDPYRMTVGPPPTWVKPAFSGADHNVLPMKRISLKKDESGGTPLDGCTVEYNPRCTTSILDLTSVQPMIKSPAESGRTITLTNGSIDNRRRHRSSRTDSGCMFGAAEELKGRRRSSGQSFRERRERERRQSAGRMPGDSYASSLIASID
ncbi:hypothetical protein EC973_008342 [Apophysomyces ossiformis]|uniref:Protein kinase domain-containing protein n=1 Tax=Apophysomyces ossiformis TaxID=679940 RepID=A0A8H7BZ58_9FUNG|nr:hypothetical protein EC973_008342 [Apophysomyces ossiformis]